MCKYAYEDFSDRAKKIMIFCHLKDNENSEMLKLCTSQRYCNNEDKYIPYKQKENCKYCERKID